MSRSDRIPKTKTVAFGFIGYHSTPEPMEICDQHNEIELNFVERGELVFRRGIETITLAEGAAIIYWAAVPHQILKTQPETQLSWFTIPLSLFLDWKLPQSFTKRLLEGGILPVRPETSFSSPYAFPKWADDFSGKSPLLRRAMKLEIEGFFCRLASDQDEFAMSAGVSQPVSEFHYIHVERMVQYITQNFKEKLTAEMVAKAVDLNSKYAMRIFRERWGITIGQFLLQQRISEAKRLLLLSNMSLVQIAYSSGFQSISRFYQAFQGQCGCSPGCYRRNHI